MNEFRKALRIVWLISGGVMLLAIALSFALDEARGASLLPPCEWKAKYNRECCACGLTTGFIAISHGRLDNAATANRAALPLYGLFAANAAGGALYLARRRNHSSP